VTAWGWPYNRSEAFEDSGNGGTKWQWDLEFHGTADRVPLMVVPEQLAFRTALGGEAAIHEHTRSLAAYARKTIPLPTLTPDDPALSGALSVFELPASVLKADANKYRDKLYFEHDIECPVTSAGNRMLLRVSTAIFNNHTDVDKLAVAVRRVFG
jgi:selenocysteine lyase/cysteine desulfurase